jgi:hypothetical protein
MFGGTPLWALGWTSGGTPIIRRPNAPRGRPQPINLEEARDPNVLSNPIWQDERGMSMCSIVPRYVEWTHLMRMFVLSVDID